ncbi:MAG: glycosyltransferase family 2 protein [Nitrospirales bacterium]
MADSVGSPPLVSSHEQLQVVFGLPVYNQYQENQLEGVIASILAQTWKNFELVIVDDASTDGTWELVKKISKLDSRIRAFRNKKRLGSIRNFCRCFEIAKPKGLFAWASQHDWYEPEWLIEMINAIQGDSEVVLAYPFVSQFGGDGDDLNLPFQEFETVGLNVHQRVLKTIWAHEGTGSMVYGLFRSSILERCGVYRSLLFPDLQLLIELAFWGSVRQVPRVLWHRRIDGSYNIRRQRLKGFASPPWYTRYSTQIVNSGALLWHRCLSPRAGSQNFRWCGWMAAREYFLANPRYRINVKRRRAFWLTREFLYGDFYVPSQLSETSASSLTSRDEAKSESDIHLINEHSNSEQKKLLKKIAHERRLREEMSGEINKLKARVMHLQTRYLSVIAKQSEVSRKDGDVRSKQANEGGIKNRRH